MKGGLAFLAGVVGGVGTEIFLWLVRMIDYAQMNLSMVLGAMVTQQVSAGTWLIGFVIHLIVSGLIALIYAVFFELFRLGTWWLGLLFGVVHAVISGAVMIAMPLMHPAMPELFPAPGFMAINYGGRSLIVFLVMHMLYGLIVGAIYQTKKTRRTAPVSEPVEPPRET